MVKKSKKGPEVDVLGMPGVTVRKALIDEAVKATSDPLKATQAEEHRERVKAQKVLNDNEPREDIEVSKQITQAILDQVDRPEPRNINVDFLPSFLRRAVVAYVNMREAQEEYADAVRELALKTSVESMPQEVVAACKAIDVDPQRLVAGLHSVGA